MTGGFSLAGWVVAGGLVVFIGICLIELCCWGGELLFGSCETTVLRLLGDVIGFVGLTGVVTLLCWIGCTIGCGFGLI